MTRKRYTALDESQFQAKDFSQPDGKSFVTAENIPYKSSYYKKG